MTDDEPVVAQISADAMDATLTVTRSSRVLTMTRDLPHPVERVWEMLTDPSLLVRWSPVVPDRTLSSEGPAISHETPDAPGVDVEVLVCHAPTELVHRWGEHQLRWTLSRSPTWTVLATVLDGHGVSRVIGQTSYDYGRDALRNHYKQRLH